MECLHGKAAASTTTNNGTFWFCGENPSCEFFCPDENCYMYTTAVAAFRASGSIHPVCPTHQKFAKLCVVKDTMKDNYGRPFFVCSERKNPWKFWYPYLYLPYHPYLYIPYLYLLIFLILILSLSSLSLSLSSLSLLLSSYPPYP
jgi:hypothetical protein